MKKIILSIIYVMCLCSVLEVRGQGIYFGSNRTRVSFDFGAGNALLIDTLYFPGTSVVNGTVSLDTVSGNLTNPRLWQIGNTIKPFFAAGGPQRGIMTDTLNSYPINADSWIVLNLNISIFNTIISFTHKYQTAIGRDGGIVEYSLDTGLTWQNVLGDCHSVGAMPGVLTTGFYDKPDTLTSGDAAFSGSSNGWQTSYIQFFLGLPIRVTGNPPCSFHDIYGLLLRFRFVSDSVLDSLDGWMINKITVEQDEYSAVPEINRLSSLNVFPNPVSDGMVHFPVLNDEATYSIEIINGIGKRLFAVPYQHIVDVSQYSNGLYFYKVSNGQQTFVGKFLIE